jgi:hypothetical protein
VPINSTGIVGGRLTAPDEVTVTVHESIPGPGRFGSTITVLSDGAPPLAALR